MLVRLKVEIALVRLQFTTFLLEQTVALFEVLSHVTLAPFGPFQSVLIAFQLIFELLQLLTFLFETLIKVCRRCLTRQHPPQKPDRRDGE